MAYYCPKCGSASVCRVSLYKARLKSNRPRGIGCLILILLLVFFPLATLLFLIGGLVLFLASWPLLVLGAAIVYWIDYYRKRKFICEVCGFVFKTEE